jgi:putative ABC transport system permease protein
MAPRDVVNSLSRTSVAVAALMVAVSVTIGVSLMVSSFRYTVIAWLGQTLQGDIYISSPGATTTQTSTAIDPQVISQITGRPGITEMYVLRSVNVDSPDGPVHIAASSNPKVSQERSFLSQDFPVEEIETRMQTGSVIVSEPLAIRLNIPRHGGSITLETDRGPREFPIAGIYYDYSSSQGTVTMSLDLYRSLWDDPDITAIALHLASGQNADQTARDLQAALASSGQSLLIRPNQALRQDVLEVFDRTFAITGALQLLATLVAFIGVLSALLSLELERQRELGILRSIGLTVRELWGLVMLETGLLGSQMQILPEPFLQALLVAVAAALLAGIYPAIRMGRMLAAEAIRYE